jgi:type I restriction enzyme S subunit
MLARVGDLAQQIRGVTYSKSEATNAPAPGSLPVLRAGNITEHGLTFTDLVFVPESRVKAQQRLRRNDVLIAASSGSLEVVGKAGRAVEDFEGGFGAFCKVLRPNERVDPNYFAHFFKTTNYRRTISSLASGANINNLRSQHLDDLQIPLPPLAEQRRIAAILDPADALRAKRTEGLAHLDDLTQSIFLDMFGDGQDWPVAMLRDIVATGDRVNYGVVQPGDTVEGGVPLIRISDLRSGRVDRTRLKLIDPGIERKYVRSRIRGNEILISCVGSTGVIAVTSDQDVGSNVARAVTRVPIENPTTRQYVAEHLRSARVQRYFKNELRTVSQPTLNGKQISETEVPLPPMDLQDEFVRRIRIVRLTFEAQSTHRSQLDALFASIQSRAFAGAL